MSGFGNAFGGSGSGFGQTNPFGQPKQSAFGNTQSSVFGQTQSPSFGQTQSVSVFGQAGQTQTSGFGQGTQSTGFGQTQTSGFGQGTQSTGFGQTQSSVFGGSQNSGFGQTQTPGFGQTQSSGFGGNQNSGLTQTTSAFGQSQPHSNPFAQSSVFGQSSSKGFGQTGISTTSSSSVFGSGTSAFGSVTSTSTTQSNLFASASGFGAVGKAGSGTAGGFSSGSNSVFGTKDSKVPGFQSSTFGKHDSTAGSSSVFGGSSTKAVFGAHTDPKPNTVGFGISTTASKTTSSVFGGGSSSSPSSAASSVFGSNQTSTVFGGKAETANVFGSKNEPEPKNVFGGFNKDANSIFGGAKKDSESSSLFRKTKTESESSNIFGGVKKDPSSLFGAQKTNSSSVRFSSSGSSTSSSSRTFGEKTSSTKPTSENVFSSGNSSGSVFGRTSNLQSTDLVTEEALKPSATTSDMSQPTQSKPISSVFGSSKVFGSGSATSGLFSFSAAGKSSGGQTSADDETGETKPFAASGASVFGGSGFGKPSGSVFGGSETSGTTGGFGSSVKQEPESGGTARLFGGETRSRDSEHGRKRTIKREDDNSTKRSRNLFTSAVADAVGGHETRSKRTDPHPTSSRSGDSNSQSEQEERDSRHGSSQKLRRLSSMSEDVSSKTAIVCKGVPAKFNKGAILRKHFSKYGSVAKVFPNINKNSATIHFHNHNSAAEAKSRGRVLAKGLPVLQIFWSSHSPITGRAAASSSTSRSSDSSGENRRRQRSQWDDDDVSSELSTMAGTEDVQKSISKSKTEPRVGSPSPPKRQRPTATHSPGRSSPTPSTSAATTSTVTPDIVSLSSLKSAVARNVHDMAKILELRDKYIREGHTKQSDLATARAFVGTCMDMCPEKERYDREDKRRLNQYEIVPGTENIPGQNPRGDPYRMVKEYSRSSADQDEPLPHELRPIPVLIQTMTYLLTEIADKGTEGKWMDWYGFLWDRTRGIRKDITQQQLISREAVELLEKCARFHVYCSERLCEEDMHVFDTKINNENLTKCLQTLKEMYHDLDTKHGIFCPNEAEFRAYIVLMNLNEGDTLREVQTLRQEVQNSWDIKFAIKIYSALSSNNYVRFFRLVKEASFLSACIIHRYFTQVRTRALQTMIKAFGSKKAQFPVSDLVRILSFDDEEEAESFCQFYGQSVVDGMVILDRNSFVIPECAYSPRRAINLIESKRMVSVGEVINGASLPPLELSGAQCSFDDNGRFKITQDLLQYAGTKDRKQVEAASPEKKVPPPVSTAVTTVAPSPVAQATTPSTPTETASPEHKPVAIPNEAVKMIAKELFWEVIDEFVAEISQGYVRAVQLYLEAGKKTVEEIVIIGTASLIRQVCTEVVDEEKARKEKEAQIEMSERKARVSEDICQDLLDELTQQEACNLATAQMRDVHAQLKKEREERCTETISEKLLEESLCDLVQEISMEVYRIDVVQRREKLEAIEKCVKLHRAARFLQVWKKEHAKRIKLKRAMLAFPCAPSSQNIDSQLKNLLPDRRDDRLVERRMYVNKQAMVALETPMEIEKREVFMNARYSLMALYRQLMKKKAWQPINMPTVVGLEMDKILSRQRDMEGLLPDTTREITWKLVVSLPDIPFTSPVTTHVNKWMMSKFRRGQVPDHPDMKYKGEVLSLYHSTVENKGKLPLQLGVCVRSIVGTLDKKEVQKVEEKRLLLGTCGIVFVMFPEDRSDDYWSEATARLAGILHAKPVYPALPLVIVVPELSHQPISREELIASLEVDSFQEDGLVSEVHVMSLCVDGGIVGVEAGLPQASDQLAESVEWLASHMPEPPELQRAGIKDFVEDFLLQEYYGPVLQNLKLKKKQHTLHQPPNTLITLYNCAIEHLAEVASSTSLTTHSCPIAEFVWYHPQEELPPAHWNMSDHLSYLYEEISLLQLPRFKYLNYQSDTWKQVCVDVWAFVQSVVKQNKGKDSVQLVTRIKSLLQKVHEDFNDVCYLLEGTDRCEPTYVNMPWTDVIDACISYRISCLPTLDKHSQEDPQRDLLVYYEEEELNDFATPTGWKEAMLNTDAQVGPTVLESVKKAVVKKLVEQTIMEEEKEEDEPVPLSMISQESNQSQFDHSLQSECGSLLSSIQAEKKAMDKYEKYLESVLMDGAGALMDEAGACMDNGHFIEPVMDAEQDWYLETPLRNRFNYLMNGNKIGCSVLDAIPEHCDEDEEEMEELQNQTISGRVDSLQENLFALRQDSHLFEERLKFLMNT